MEKKITQLAEVKLEASRDRKELLATFDRIREQIVSGDCTGFTAVLDHPGGTYTTIATGCESSRASAGALLELAVRRLGFEYRDELL